MKRLISKVVKLSLKFALIVIICFIIKFIFVTLALETVLNLLSKIGFVKILFISLVVSTAAYLIGDLLVLTRSKNTIATIVDVVLSFLTLYLFTFFQGFNEIKFTVVLISTAVIGVGEWFFHKFYTDKLN